MQDDTEFFGVLAQLVERLNGIEEVSGSNTLCSTPRKRLTQCESAAFLFVVRARS